MCVHMCVCMCETETEFRSISAVEGQFESVSSLYPLFAIAILKD